MNSPLTPTYTPPHTPSNYVPLEEFPEFNIKFSDWEISQIRQSWASMRDDHIEVCQEKAPVGTASAFFCQQFYENLLGEYPELSVLYPSIKSQASNMAGILSLVIAQLDNLQAVRNVLIALGKRHSRIIGVEVIHYELVGNALLRTLADRLDDKFTSEIENAWIKFFSYITNLMLQAGEDPPLPVQTLYPVLTPTESNSSTISSVARRVLKPRVSDMSGVKSINSTLVTSSSPGCPVSPGHMASYQGSCPHASNALAGLNSAPCPAMPATGVAHNVAPYNPSTSHFKVVGKQKKRKGKGQECIIM